MYHDVRGSPTPVPRCVPYPERSQSIVRAEKICRSALMTVENAVDSRPGTVEASSSTCCPRRERQRVRDLGAGGQLEAERDVGRGSATDWSASTWS